jgi:hypothetical protein
MLPAQRRLKQRKEAAGGDACEEGDDSGSGSGRKDLTKAYMTFGTDTHAGRLLQKLYGGAPAVTKVKYPKLKSRADTGAPRPRFIPGGGKVEHDPRRVRPREIRERAAKVVRPAFGRPDFEPIAPIEWRDGCGRRRLDDIEAAREEADWEDARMPPLKPVTSGDAAKRRLQNKFQFEGGKALPEAGTLPAVEHVPLDLQLSVQAKAKRDAFRRARREGGEGGGGTAKKSGPVAVTDESAAYIAMLEARFKEVSHEVSERVAFLERLEELGATKELSEARGPTTREIHGLLAEMEKLDNQLHEAKGES